MRITGPIKYVNLFLQDLIRSDPDGKVSDFAKRFKESRDLRSLVHLLYPNITVRVV